MDSAIRACGWIALLLALYGLYLALGNAGPPAAQWWVTSDSLYPVHVFIDTVLEGNSFSGWKFSIAPCWFPDLFLTAVFMAVTQNPILATLLAGFIQIVVLVIGLVVLCKATGWTPGLLPVVGALAAGTGAALYLSSNPAQHPGLFGQFFLPQTHVGSLILTIYALALAALVLREADGQLPRWQFAAFAVLCFLGAFSDLMFVVQTLVPLTVVLGVAVAVRIIALRPGLLLLGAGWPVAMIGYAINRVFINTTPVSAQSDRRIIHALRTFVGGFLSNLRSLEIVHLVALLWVAVALVIIWRGVRRSASDRDKLAAIVLGVLVLAGLSSIAAVIAGGSTTLTLMNDYQSTLRYLHPGFLLPVIALPFVGLLVMERAIRNPVVIRSIGAGIAVCILLLALSATRRSEDKGKSLAGYTPPIVEFVDELAAKEGVKTGVAGYWQARLITLLSRSGTRAYAVSPSMEPFLWVSNAEWYRPVFGGQRPRTDFVVLDDPLFHLDAPQAVQVFGQPARTTSYQGVRVLLYRCKTCALPAEERANLWMDEPLSHYRQELVSPVKELVLRPGERTTVPLKVTNPGPEAWSSSGKRPVNVGYKVLRDSTVIMEGERTKLPSVLGGGESADVQFSITAPPEPGSYTVRVSLVQETVVWLMDVGGAPLALPLTVR